jgi:23S rRNA (cytidine1920-2'-O)/16S rRNA (cytidine1409-2'-O)-methyltransferase
MAKTKVVKKRLDELLVERGLLDSLDGAKRVILAGEVHVDGAREDKAGTRFAADATIEVHGRAQKYASRGGLKLEGALEDFGIDCRGRICLDVGASTGGFTDCLLQHGAARVYAVDVNTEQLAWKLRQDRRVVRVQRNARELRDTDAGELVDIVVVDVSFISAGKVLVAAAALAKPTADLLILVKPQFELAKAEVSRGGIVSDTSLHQKAIAKVQDAAVRAGLEVLGVRPSRIAGAGGNQEYFLHARKKVR